MDLRRVYPSILCLCFLVALTACAEAKIVGSPEKGGRTAAQWCSECHVVRAGQAVVPGSGAPSFRQIAKDPQKDLAHLRRFMSELHLPMPTFRLWPEEQGNVLAYIITQGYDH